MNVGWREITAQHEAGHAVVSLVLGWSVRYATLRPRSPDAVGRTATIAPRAWSRLDAGTIFLAGMAAESFVIDDRRYMIASARTDLRWTRDMARAIVARRAGSDEPPPAGVDPSWSEWELGAWMWRRACDLVAEYHEAIHWVAKELYASPRAVGGSWMRRVIANSPRSNEPAEPDEWWAPRYSRLRWNKS